MTTEHTPGPWVATEDPMSSQDYQTLVALPGRAGAMGTWLAFVQHNWNEAEAGERRISWKEAEANARLIAAAPELLEALEELSLKAVVGTDDERYAALRKTWAAIAKAKGAA